MKQVHISNAHAKPGKLFYVVANVIIIDPVNLTCLLLKRGEKEKVHPGKWAFPGGKLEHSSVAELLISSGTNGLDGIENILGKLAMIEAKEECGLSVDAESSAIIHNKVFVRPDGIPVLMTVVTAEYNGGQIVLEAHAFTDYAWVSASTIGDYSCISGIEDEAKRALAQYTR